MTMDPRTIDEVERRINEERLRKQAGLDSRKEATDWSNKFLKDETRNQADRIVGGLVGDPNTRQWSDRDKAPNAALGHYHTITRDTRQPTNEEICQYHSPDNLGIQHINTIRAAAVNFLNAIDANCPPCADSVQAKSYVRVAMMLANAAIALDGAV